MTNSLPPNSAFPFVIQFVLEDAYQPGARLAELVSHTRAAFFAELRKNKIEAEPHSRGKSEVWAVTVHTENEREALMGCLNPYKDKGLIGVVTALALAKRTSAVPYKSREREK